MENTEKKVIIITSYIDYPLDYKISKNDSSFIICTDGGYDIALKNKIKPNLILGDLDSIQSKVPDNISIQKFNPEKDFTDLELAVKTASDMGFTDLEIWGGIGGRLDHTIANIQIISGYSSKFSSLIMKDGRNKCFILYGNENKKNYISKEAESYISLFSLSEKCTGVTIQNVKYPLTNHTLTNTFPLGVSNEFTEKEAVLSVKDGILLVIISKS